MDVAALPIPDYQPIPFPAPLWLMNVMLVIGFYIHAIPMNVALMGGLVAAVFLLYAMSNKEHPYAARLGNSLAYSLPFFTTAAINNGIVPLLFLQVIYGPLIYSSSIIMATFWFSILFLLALGYYAFYVFTYKRERFGNRAPWVLIGSSFLFLIIAFFFVNNMTLMLTPEKFLGLYQQNQNGLNLNLTEPTLVPRLTHFVAAAVAVTSLVIGCFGLYQAKRDEAYSQWLIKKASSLFLLITIAQIGIGAWFFLTLPEATQGNFLGGDTMGTHLFRTGMALDVVAILSAALAFRKGSTGAFKVTLVSTLLLIAAMVGMRHLVRVYALAGIFDPTTHPVEPQWSMIAAFVVLAVAMLALFGWFSKVVWKAYHGPKHDWSEVNPL